MWISLWSRESTYGWWWRNWVWQKHSSPIYCEVGIHITMRNNVRVLSEICTDFPMLSDSGGPSQIEKKELHEVVNPQKIHFTFLFLNPVSECYLERTATECSVLQSTPGFLITQLSAEVMTWGRITTDHAIQLLCRTYSAIRLKWQILLV